jgi:hypothetical protein
MQPSARHATLCHIEYNQSGSFGSPAATRQLPEQAHSAAPQLRLVKSLTLGECLANNAIAAAAHLARTAAHSRRYAPPRAPKPVTGAQRFEQVEALLLAHFADDQPGRGAASSACLAPRRSGSRPGLAGRLLRLRRDHVRQADLQPDYVAANLAPALRACLRRSANRRVHVVRESWMWWQSFPPANADAAR